MKLSIKFCLGIVLAYGANGRANSHATNSAWNCEGGGKKITVWNTDSNDVAKLTSIVNGKVVFDGLVTADYNNYYGSYWDIRFYTAKTGNLLVIQLEGQDVDQTDPAGLKCVRR